MKKLMMALAAALISAPVLADPIKEDEYFSAHAQGCMLLRECTDHVEELKTVTDLNKDSIIENAKNQIAAAAAEAIAGALPGMMDSAMPELPDATGGARPLSTTTEPALPF